MVYNKFYTKENWENVNYKNKQLLEDYLIELKIKNNKESTIQQYKNDIRIVFIYIFLNFDNKYILELKKREFKQMILDFKEKYNFSNARVNRVLSACKNLLNFLEDEEEYDYAINQLNKIKSFKKEPIKNICFLKNDDILYLYNYLMKNYRYQEATFLALAYESAGRKNELIQVKKDSISDIRNNTNTVIGKRGKKIKLIYFDLTKKAAKKFLEMRGEDDNSYLFINKYGKPASSFVVYKWVKSWEEILKDKIGEEKLNVHSLRHSSLENYSNGTHNACKKNKIKKIELNKLKLIANHDSSETTQSYLKDHSKEELEDLFNISII